MSSYKVISSKGKEIFTDVSLHPGEVILMELEARNISQKQFAEMIGWRTPHLNELIKGKRHVSAMLAIKLEQQLGIDAAFWLRIQMDYDLEMARKQAAA